ncbi:ParA family protein [Cetobacterium sp. SF1]|uniref:ParA family protein n=1 Tax=unclassified Cetobacterium TaxID=2630983 RepID=UPI003CF16551
MGKIITVKNNKGGVGKTFLTTQLASGFSYLEKKVLILTSDPQNNIFNYLFRGDKNFKKGLKAEVLKKDGEYFRLRTNLYFLPLEDVKFSHMFLRELPIFLERIKNEFDYVFIDSIPTLKIDEVFINNSDGIIIPSFSNSVTLEGVLNLLKTIDINKVRAIVTNNYKNTSVQKEYYEMLRTELEDYNILVTEPIKNLSFIETMLEDKKTVWEFSNKVALEVQKILIEIIKNLETY